MRTSNLQQEWKCFSAQSLSVTVWRTQWKPLPLIKTKVLWRVWHVKATFIWWHLISREMCSIFTSLELCGMEFNALLGDMNSLMVYGLLQLNFSKKLWGDGLVTHEVLAACSLSPFPYNTVDFSVSLTIFIHASHYLAGETPHNQETWNKYITWKECKDKATHLSFSHFSSD